MPQNSSPSIGASVSGLPRIGADRELKRAVESYWRSNSDVQALNEAGAEVRKYHYAAAHEAGLSTIPTGTFSWYDHVLDTAFMLGAIPARFADVSGPDQISGLDAARYFAMARGTDTVPPMEMTKWFDTNYHYLVPEIGPDTQFALNAVKQLGELSEAADAKLTPRPVVVGPFTFLALSKANADAPEDFDPLARLDDLVEVYVQLLGQLREAGAEWVQLDEPSLVRDLDEATVAAVKRSYERLSAANNRPSILVSTYFGAPVEALPALAQTGVEAFGLDLTSGLELEDIARIPEIAEKQLVLGLIDGRNVWRTDLDAASKTVAAWRDAGLNVAVSSSCSLLHVPYDLAAEKSLDPELVAGLAFGRQKLDELVALDTLLRDPEDQNAAQQVAQATEGLGRLRAFASSGQAPQINEQDRIRPDRSVRVAAQSEALNLPPLPTTTIGSFPQTTALRKARADLRAGTIDDATYQEAMRESIREVVKLQEEIGLDVLVHGEPERNDMVQYFAEQLVGYATTTNGWVQSYGSRCVRPPILYGDVSRPNPMSVEWTSFAQSLTDKHMKGMLTGPVTMLAWSFVRDDQPLGQTADQVALALRQEVQDLEAAGVKIIQVDEAALRELLPLRKADQAAYLDWSVNSFRLATAGVKDTTQIHTHLCYSEFGEIIESIDALDADVTSIEAARSGMELLADVTERGFQGGLGPGVYDIHSPRVPSVEEVQGQLAAALGSLPAERLWVNPDCGLKTRGYDEVEPSLKALVAAAASARAGI